MNPSDLQHLRKGNLNRFVGVSRILCLGSFFKNSQIDSFLFNGSVCHVCVGEGDEMEGAGRSPGGSYSSPSPTARRAGYASAAVNRSPNNRAN